MAYYPIYWWWSQSMSPEIHYDNPYMAIHPPTFSLWIATLTHCWDCLWDYQNQWAGKSKDLLAALSASCREDIPMLKASGPVTSRLCDPCRATRIRRGLSENGVAKIGEDDAVKRCQTSFYIDNRYGCFCFDIYICCYTHIYTYSYWHVEIRRSVVGRNRIPWRKDAIKAWGCWGLHPNTRKVEKPPESALKSRFRSCD